MGITIEPSCRIATVNVHVLLLKGPTHLPCLLCPYPTCFIVPCHVCSILPCLTLLTLALAMPANNQSTLVETYPLVIDGFWLLEFNYGPWNFPLPLSFSHTYTWLLQEPYYKRRPFGDMQMCVSLLVLCNVVPSVVYCCTSPTIDVRLLLTNVRTSPTTFCMWP